MAATTMNFTNSTEVEQSETYTASATTTQQFTWSLTQSASVTATASFKAGLARVAEVTASISVTAGLSATESKLVSNSQSWSFQLPMKVPAHSRVSAQGMVTQQTYNVPSTVTVNLSGSVNVWSGMRVQIAGGEGLHFCWFIPVAQVLGDCIQHHLVDDLSNFTMAPNGINMITKGIFSGGPGVASNVVMSQTPTGGLTAAARPMVRTIHMPRRVGMTP